MKADFVLTMDQYLDECCGAPKRVSPPGSNARHVLIMAGDTLESGARVHGCRCDRWGHPCPNCVKPRRANAQGITSLAEDK
jgi:hypothetical protein